MSLQVKLLSQYATLPSRGSLDAAGYDLSSAQACVIPPGDKALVKTDIAICMPEGVYGRVAPRSGLSWKKHIGVGGGVIDRDYRGNVGVILFNHGKEDLKIKPKDRVAQLILERYATVPIIAVSYTHLTLPTILLV